jgi:hypothetical protein
VSLRDFPQSARSRAAGVWAFRARAEAIASGRFVQLGRDLADVNAPQVVVELAQRAAEEEARHIEICMDLVECMGAHIEKPSTPEFRLPDQLKNKQRMVLLQMVGTSCINETISATVLAEMMRRAESGQMHDSIQEILRDEIDHGRMGWAYVAHLAQEGEAAIEDELFDTPDPDDRLPFFKDKKLRMWVVFRWKRLDPAQIQPAALYFSKFAVFLHGNGLTSLVKVCDKLHPTLVDL